MSLKFAKGNKVEFVSVFNKRNYFYRVPKGGYVKLKQ